MIATGVTSNGEPVCTKARSIIDITRIPRPCLIVDQCPPCVYGHVVMRRCRSEGARPVQPRLFLASVSTWSDH